MCNFVCDDDVLDAAMLLCVLSRTTWTLRFCGSVSSLCPCMLACTRLSGTTVAFSRVNEDWSARRRWLVFLSALTRECSNARLQTRTMIQAMLPGVVLDAMAAGRAVSKLTEARPVALLAFDICKVCYACAA